MPNKISLEDFWKVIDSKWKYIAKDSTGEVFIYDEKPIKTDSFQWFPEGEYHIIGPYLFGILDLPENWEESLTERPVDYSSMIGMFGKFWSSDEEPEVYRWDYLIEYNDSLKAENGTWWKHFKPGLPPEKIEI